MVTKFKTGLCQIIYAVGAVMAAFFFFFFFMPPMRSGSGGGGLGGGGPAVFLDVEVDCGQLEFGDIEIQEKRLFCR